MFIRKMKRWIEPNPVSVPGALCDFVGGHPLVAETLVRRGLSTVDAARAFIDATAYTPAPASALPGLSPAVARILSAVRDKERVCVWGDFDVDGQTATTVLVEMLRDLGANVFYHIPVRATESHGVKIPENFALLNQARLFGLWELSKSGFRNLQKNPDDDCSALACQQCGECLPKCPINVPIIDQLQETAELLAE